jgi:hypothetical protein
MANNQSAIIKLNVLLGKSMQSERLNEDIFLEAVLKG